MTRTRLLAVLALAGCLLAGCRSEPGVAAYVGDTKITEAEVTRVYDATVAAFGVAVKEQGGPADAQAPITRKYVVTALVAREVFRNAAREKGVSPTDLPADQVGQSLGLPPSEFVTVFTEYLAYRDGLTADATPGTPTEEDLHGVYERLIASGALEPDQSFADFRTALTGQNLQSIALTVAARNLLAPIVESADVVVNPRYAPVELDLLGVRDQQGGRHALIVLPVGDDADAGLVVSRS